ncbi:calcium/proton exchanger [Synechococcus sp. CBW1004]|uniref:calcium/proton exchanger n=1 Tax=Synechococcus sp. CBW1004 TaxID=1353136 RepID=UPI0018CD4D83|nr:calcium/proton exchanger [Synechococcus sp. CBW1004]QPN63693.1 calcium/proton exchanger [Synechococcus sp. CBW1004]
MNLRNKASLALLALVPVSVAAEVLHWGQGALFLSSALAIAPLAIWLSTATEELAIALGPTLGALLTAVFGNASELIIGLTALKAGLVEIVKASITGTLIANLLLALGLAFLVGGIGRQEQQFQPTVARVNGSLMTLAVVAILIPTINHLGLAGELPVSEAAEQGFSQFVAWLLLLVYGLTLLFSLGTHRSLYEAAEAEMDADWDEGDEAQHKPRLLPWLMVLMSATAALAYESELFVGVLEPVTQSLGLSAVFTGVVLLPLLGGVAEFITCISLARRNNVDLSVSVALGSTLLVALLVVPLLVLLSPLLGHPLTLRLSVAELLAVITAVVVSNLVTLDGRSNWLEGVLLVATYIILGAGFALQSGPLV